MFFDKLNCSFYFFKKRVSNNINKILDFIGRFELPCISFMSSFLIGMVICWTIIKIGEIMVYFIFPNHIPMLAHKVVVFFYSRNYLI